MLHLKGLKVKSQEIIMLIRADTSYAYRTLEIRTGEKRDTFAAKSSLC